MKAEGGRQGARGGRPGSQGGPAARVRAMRGCHFGVGQLRRRPVRPRGKGAASQVGKRWSHGCERRGKAGCSLRRRVTGAAESHVVGEGPSVGLGAEGQPELGEGRKLCPWFQPYEGKGKAK